MAAIEIVRFLDKYIFSYSAKLRSILVKQRRFRNDSLRLLRPAGDKLKHLGMHKIQIERVTNPIKLRWRFSKEVNALSIPARIPSPASITCLQLYKKLEKRDEDF